MNLGLYLTVYAVEFRTLYVVIFNYIFSIFNIFKYFNITLVSGDFYSYIISFLFLFNIFVVMMFLFNDYFFDLEYVLIICFIINFFEKSFKKI